VVQLPCRDAGSTFGRPDNLVGLQAPQDRPAGLCRTDELVEFFDASALRLGWLICSTWQDQSCKHTPREGLPCLSTAQCVAGPLNRPGDDQRFYAV
jgi:hypothetical protein